jgi:hypothetical protein
MLFTKILAGVINNIFDRDNNTIKRAIEVITLVLLSFLANKVTQLFITSLDLEGFEAFTLTGYVINDEIGFAF